MQGQCRALRRASVADSTTAQRKIAADASPASVPEGYAATRVGQYRASRRGRIGHYGVSTAERTAGA
eukprot:3941726-Rhodomonas_salina.1